MNSSLPIAGRHRVGAEVWMSWLGLAGVSLLLRTQHLSDLGMHFDECCSWKISQFPWNEMIDAVSRDAAHPPLFYILMKGWGAVGLTSPAAIRGFSVLFGLGTIAAAYWFVHTALDRSARELCANGDPLDESSMAVAGGNDRNLLASLAAALVGMGALHVEMSMQARPYTLGTCLALVAATCLLRAVRAPGRTWDWMGFGVASTLLSLTHYYCLFTVAALYLFGLGAMGWQMWATGWSTATRRVLAGLGLSFWGNQLVWSFWLPTFLWQRSRSTSQLWMGPLDWQGLSDNCWMALAGGQSIAAPSLESWLAVAVWGGTIVALLVWGGAAGRLVATAAGIPILGIVAYALAVRNVLGAKYLIFAQVFVLVGWALLLARVPWRPARFVVGLAIWAWGAYWCWQYAEVRDTYLTVAGVKGAVAYLDERRGDNEPVLCGSPFVQPIVQQYAREKQRIYASYRGNHRESILGGPPLRDDECRDLDRVEKQAVGRIWTIDVYEMFRPQSRFEVKLPDGWTLESQEEFRENYGIACVLAVRAYRRSRK